MELSEVLDVISHDVKSPLAKAKSQLMIILHTAQSPQQTKERLQTVDELLTRMNTQLNMLFESLYFLTGNVQLLYQFFVLSEVIQHSIPTDTIEIKGDTQINILGDPDNISRALRACIEDLQTEPSDNSIGLTVEQQKSSVHIHIVRSHPQPVQKRPTVSVLLAYYIIKAHGGRIEKQKKNEGYLIVLPLKAKKIKQIKQKA